MSKPTSASLIREDTPGETSPRPRKRVWVVHPPCAHSNTRTGPNKGRRFCKCRNSNKLADGTWDNCPGFKWIDVVWPIPAVAGDTTEPAAKRARTDDNANNGVGAITNTQPNIPSLSQPIPPADAPSSNGGVVGAAQPRQGGEGDANHDLVITKILDDLHNILLHMATLDAKINVLTEKLCPLPCSSSNDNSNKVDN